MKRLLVVGGMSSDAEDVESFELLTNFVKQVIGEDTTVYATYLDKLALTIAPGAFEAFDGRNNVSLSEMDCIWIRGPKMRLLGAYTYYVSRFCAQQGITCVNDYSAYYPGTKVAQSIVFLEEDAPFLPTLYSADKQLLCTRAEATFGCPYILKTNVGSHGDSNYLVHSAEEAAAIIAKEPQVDFLAQAFCPNDRDFRLLLMGDTQLLFERKGGADTHLNNTSKGAEATRADDALPPEIIAKARQVAARLKLMISGVDVMPHLETGEYYFLEINSQPQLRTGALLDEKRQALRQLLDQYLL